VPIERAATLRQAEEFLRQGRLDAAIAACVSVTADRPDDWKAAVLLGNLYVRAGQIAEAVVQLVRAANGLIKDGRHEQALTVYQRVLALQPDHEHAKRMVASLTAPARAIGTKVTSAPARERLDGADSLRAAIEERLHRDSFAEVVPLARRLLEIDPTARQEIVAWGWAAALQAPEDGYRLVSLSTDAAVLHADWAFAAAALQEFVTRVPGHALALVRLVAVCTEGGLEATLGSSKAQLVDVYLASGAAAEAERLVEDLLAREPWERAHVERFKRALALQGERDPDAVVAERLAGRQPFASTDLATDRLDLLSGVEGWLGKPDARTGRPAAALVPETRAASAVPEQTPKSEGGEAESPRSAAEEYARGLSLYDAGDLDGCVAAMTAAVGDPSVGFQSAALVARVHRERGAIHEAIRWFDRAADAPTPDTHDRCQVLYELADLLELAEDPARALAVCLELQAESSSYRDISHRVERLARAQARG